MAICVLKAVTFRLQVKRFTAKLTCLGPHTKQSSAHDTAVCLPSGPTQNLLRHGLSSVSQIRSTIADPVHSWNVATANQIDERYI